MTTHGPFDAIRIPILGVLGKGQRAARSARRVIAISGQNGPDADPGTPPVTAPQLSIQHRRST
jgi:hypothetical protein